jgi:class 3 adenylate cyclase
MASERLKNYLDKHGLRTGLTFSIGTPISTVDAVVGSVETSGAVLFADLSGYSKQVTELDPVEASVYAAHFYAWLEDAIGKRMDTGIVDKFIGDEVMMVFPWDEVEGDPLEVAIRTALAFLDFDPFAFDPRIGIAEGPFAVSLVGTSTTGTISAMGHIVNLAARCSKGDLGPRSVRVATENVDAVKRIFTEPHGNWKVLEENFEPKNMPSVRTVVVERQSRWVPQFEYEEWIGAHARRAREAGAVVQATRVNQKG